jgi:ribosomal protein S25
MSAIHQSPARERIDLAPAAASYGSGPTLEHQRARVAWLFVTPMLVAVALVAAWPLGRTIAFSFTDAYLDDLDNWAVIGFANRTTPGALAKVVEFIAKQAKPSYEMEIHQQLSKPTSSYGDESGIDEDEEIIQQCIEVIRSEQKASVSLLQRRLKLGYGRAARIMDELENRGLVGPSKGAEPRDILIDLDVVPQPEAAP